ncbi:MAG: hypothetical protein HOK28_05940 [Deltaproteobacteria bacterium]|nr:hypothetical protein [Deltaproteobacteria bacterium]
MQKNTVLIMSILLLSSGCGENDSESPEGNTSTMVNQLALEDCSEFGCPNGCVQIDYGMDENANGALDASEIDGTEYICHGSNGETGETGETGEQGETGIDGADAYQVLIDSEKYFVAMYGCVQGYQETNIGLDDGFGGGVADDGILQETEILTSMISCLAPDLDDDSLLNMDDDCPQIYNITDACAPSYTQDGSECLPDYAQSGTACNDGNNDTSNDVCNGGGSCSGTVYSCPDPTVCTLSYTQNGSGCVPDYAQNDTACNDGNNGTKNDACNGAGSCSGTVYSCPGATACTASYTQDGSGCLPNHAQGGTACNDGNDGTKNDVCNGGGLCSGTAYSCPGTTSCTPNYTQNGSTCFPYYASNGTACNDGNNLTFNDVCNGSGSCSGTPF